jgi:hypothetical protein
MMQGWELAIRDGLVVLPAQIASRKGPERETVGVKWWILLKIFFFPFGVIGTAMPVRCSI